MLAAAFLYFLIAASTVCCANLEEATTFDCGILEAGNIPLCLEQTIVLYCNTTNPSLKWKIPCNYTDSKYELDFNSKDKIGDNKTCHSFRANLADKSGLTLFSSLTFTAQLKYNNTYITCSDGYSGKNYTCPITMAGKASEPLNVSVAKKNETVKVKWEPPNFSGGVPIECYDITVSPIPHDATCTSSVNFSVPDTDITINGFGCSSYNFTVQARNCVGHGSSFKNSTYSELPSKVLNLNKTENGSIKWDQPFNGGENILHYTVSHVHGSESWNTTQTSFNVFSVLSNGEYNISIQAVNCHGKGDPVFICVEVEHPPILYTLFVILVLFLFTLLTPLIISSVVFAYYKSRKKLSYADMDEVTKTTCIQLKEIKV